MNEFRFAVALRFSGSSFGPDQLISALGMPAKFSRKIGDRPTTAEGVKVGDTYTSNYCTFNIERYEEEDLSAMLERFSTSLEKHKQLFDTIRLDGGRIEFFIGWFSEGNSGDTFSCELLRKLGDLKIDLALDVYGSDAKTE
jgi:hypothetical protein